MLSTVWPITEIDNRLKIIGTLLTTLVTITAYVWYSRRSRDKDAAIEKYLSNDIIRNPDLFKNYTRLNVIGSIGSGKSTLAKRLSDEYALKYIGTDYLWTGGKPGKETFRNNLRKEMDIDGTNDKYIIDGNAFRTAPDIIWKNVQCIFWIDVGLYTTLYQYFIRTFYRVFIAKSAEIKEFKGMKSVWKHYHTFASKWIPMLAEQYPKVKIIRITTRVQYKSLQRS